jgi:hypothetical protein
LFSDNQLKKLLIDIVKPGNKIVTFKAASNDLTEIEPKLVNRLKVANLIDFTNNTCIDAIYNKNSTAFADFQDFYSEVALKCKPKDDEEEQES